MRTRNRTLEYFCVLMVAIGTAMAAPTALSDAPPRALFDWWDVSCWLLPEARWCPKPIKDPQIVPPSDPDVYGPVQ